MISDTTMLKPVTDQELKRRYKNGERDFRNLKIHHAKLSETNLSKADFSGSEFYGGTLFGSKFTDCKFIKTKFEWMDMNFADFTGADFSQARLEWLSFDHSKVKGTIFRKTHIEKVSFYGTPIDIADLTNTTMIKCFRSESEVTVADLDLMIKGMRSHGFSTDAITNIERVREKTKRMQEIQSESEEDKPYQIKTGSGSYLSQSGKKEYASKSKGKGAYEKKGHRGRALYSLENYQASRWNYRSRFKRGPLG